MIYNYRFILAILIIFPFSHTLQAAKVYKWTDDDGNVHYTQKKPPVKTVTEMKVDIPKPDAASTTKPRVDPREALKDIDKGKEEKQEKESTAQKEAEVRTENCKRAQQQFQTINSSGRLYEIDSKGERHYWDDATRISKLAEAQKSIEEWCQ